MNQGKGRHVWTLQEEQILRNIYVPNKNRQQLAKILGKTVASVSYKIQVLGLSSQSQKNKIWRWSKIEDDILIRNYKKYGEVVVADILGRSIGAVNLRFFKIKDK